MSDNRPKVYNDVMNAYTSGGNITMTANILINTTTTALNTSTGALMVNGGGGFNGNVYANNIYSNNSQLTPSPVNTKGDIYIFSTINDRLPASTNGSVLVSDSSVPLGVRWTLNSSVFNGYNEYYTVSNMGSSGSTSSTQILKTSLTTGQLSGGIYTIQLGYWINPNTSNGGLFEISVYVNAVNTTGNLIHQNINKPTTSSVNTPYYDSITQTMGSGIANIGLWYREQVASNTLNISNARLTISKSQ